MDRRAYAILKSVETDDDQRVITGTATTPTPDRLGDIIEPLGVTYTNPTPLLLYHDSRQPVGTVEFQKPTRNGVRFTARFARALTPPRLVERIEEAWQSVKLRLIRGVSIGFRPLQDGIEEITDDSGHWTGGLRFTKTELLELSLVAIPANMDADIATIKSFADRRLAAPGVAPVRIAPTLRRPGLPEREAAMNRSEQIRARRAELQTKSARLETLMGVETPDTAQQEELATLPAEMRELNTDIDRLEALDQAQARLASPVVARSFAEGAAARNPAQAAERVEVRSVLEPGIEFARYAITLMAARGNPDLAIAIAKARYPDQPRIQMLHRAAVAGGTTTDSTWAGPLVYAQTLIAEFMEFLRPRTVIGKFGTNGIPSLRRVPFNVRITGQTSGGSAAWVGQGVPKPLTKFDYTAVTLTWAKIAAISVFSEELARFSSPSAEALVRDGLTGAIVERMDTDFLDPAKSVSANVSPASITNGVAAITSAGSDADAVRTDVQSLVGAFIAANLDLTSGVWIMPTTTALALSLMRNALGQKEFPDITMLGGTFEGLPVIASQYAAIGSPASNQVVLVSAQDIFLSDDGGVSIDASREASLEMSDDPANEAGTVVSMYQTNQIALRAERYINWAKRRAAAAQYIADVTWGESSPA